MDMRKCKALLLAFAYILINLGVYFLIAEQIAKMKLFVLLSAGIGAALLLLLAVCRRLDYDLKKCFLPVCLLCGLLFMLAVPIFRGADEELHFYRAYEVSQGHMSSELRDLQGGRELPASLRAISPEDTLRFSYSDLAERFGIALDRDKTAFIPFTTTALYAPVQYIPQAVGIALGNAFGAPPMISAYLGRVCNFLAWGLLCFLAIRFLGGMPLAFLIPLLPMSLHTATTLSPDAVTNALAMLFTACILRLSYIDADKPLPKKSLVFLFLMAWFIALCKIVYLPLCALFFMIPASRFGSKRSCAAYRTVLIVSCIALNLGWLGYSVRFLQEVKDGVNAAGQLMYIVNHPLRYVMILLRTISQYANTQLHSMVGANLCLFDVPVHLWISNIYLIFLLYLASHHTLPDIKKSGRYLAALVAMCVCILIYTSLYIQWNAVGAALIEGVQGRYFLPLLMLLPFAFKARQAAGIRKPLVFAAVLLPYPVILTLLLKHLQ